RARDPARRHHPGLRAAGAVARSQDGNGRRVHHPRPAARLRRYAVLADPGALKSRQERGNGGEGGRVTAGRRYLAGVARVAAATLALSFVLPDRKSTRLNSSHGSISYAVFCLKKKTVSSYMYSC